MTNPNEHKELAEKIVRQYFDLPVMGRDGNDVQDLMDRVSESLKEMYEKGREEGQNTWSFKDGWNEAIDASVKVAEATEFNRLCEPHEVQCRTSFHGCKEIAVQLKKLKKEG